MSTYVSKRCPHCGYYYQTMQSGSQRFYGSPFIECEKCHHEFIDKDAIEIAVSGIKPADREHFRPGLLPPMVLYLIFLCVGLYYQVLSLTIMGGLFLAVFGYVIWSQCKDYKTRQEFFKEEEKASEERLSNYTYAKRLVLLGYNVPSKYLKGKECKDVIVEAANELTAVNNPKEEDTPDSPLEEKKIAEDKWVCPECNTRVPKGSSFCFKCGKKFMEE